MNQPYQPELLSRALSDGVLILTLGGGRAHPLSSAMIAALHEAVLSAGADADVRVVVIHGPGGIFCAGHDLKEIARHRADPDEGTAFLTGLFADCSALMVALSGLCKPTIAMVEGIATAAGLQLAAACDIVFASDAARFQLPGVNNGGFCTTPSVGVSRAISLRHTMELALSGEALDAEWALRAGLVSRVVPADQLEQEVRAFAERLAGRNPGPIAAGKAALLAQRALPLAEAYAQVTPVMVSHFMDPGRRSREAESPFGKGG